LICALSIPEPWSATRAAFTEWQIRGNTLEAIFAQPETTTLEALRAAGFSDTIVERFFRPFLSGIFLEPDLQTSGRMFGFVFQMFALGGTALPAGGLAKIPKQLATALPAGQPVLRRAACSPGSCGRH
jgi:hypothetical protein